MAANPRESSAPVEVHHLAGNVTIWHRYDANLKADLFSTALRLTKGVCLIDPIHVDSNAATVSFATASVFAILLTNGNHERDSAFFAKSLAAPIYARSEAGISGSVPPAETLFHGTLRVIAIDGAGPGEIAIYDERDGGTMIVGDALINFGSHGFTFLPAKYCSNPKQMRKSLGDLSVHSFERMCFAHGTPIVAQARERLLTLLREAA